MFARRSVRVSDRNGAIKAHKPQVVPIGIVVLRAVSAIHRCVVPAAVSSTAAAAAAATRVATATTTVSAAVRHDVFLSVFLG
jgi:hypothetical protein